MSPLLVKPFGSWKTFLIQVKHFPNSQSQSSFRGTATYYSATRGRGGGTKTHIHREKSLSASGSASTPLLPANIAANQHFKASYETSPRHPLHGLLLVHHRSVEKQAGGGGGAGASRLDAIQTRVELRCCFFIFFKPREPEKGQGGFLVEN